jgi:hypothetical protein
MTIGRAGDVTLLGRILVHLGQPIEEREPEFILLDIFGQGLEDIGRAGALLQGILILGIDLLCGMIDCLICHHLGVVHCIGSA